MITNDLHIGLTGPIHIPSLDLKFEGDRSKWPIGVGGTPVNHLINAFLELGYRLSVFSSSPEIEVGNSFEWHEENISIYIGPYRKRAKFQVFDFYAIEREFIKKTILRVKPDLIHAHWQYEWAWGALETGIPTIVTCHDSPYHVLKAQPDLFRFFRLLIAIIVLKKATYLTAVSKSCAIGLKLLTSKKIEIIPNFEPDTVFSYYNASRALPIKNIKVAMINNGFTKLKNVGVGIKAFQNFRYQHPDAELHLFGKSFADGEEAYQWCKSESTIANIYFHGHLDFDDLMKELSVMDLFLHTSKQESFGMAVVESMAMGIPVIAGKDSGGPEWILQDGGGILVDIKSVDEVENALYKIIEPEIYISSSKKAREVAMKQFSKKTVVKKYLEFYKLVMKL